jgi:transcriptional antiterminator Rof (Rho-off)
MQTYQPIACHLHDTYESAIVSRQHLALRWLDNGRERQQTVRPLDLKTTDGAEWLAVETSHGEALSIRLDWILQADTV